MWFWWFMLICDSIIPVVMIVAGRMMWKHCPKDINGIIGYRTSRSMKNAETWKFAHHYCGKLWWKLGIITIIPTVFVHIPFFHSTENTIGIVATVLMTVQCVVLFATVFSTEHALKKAFTDDGIKK